VPRRRVVDGPNPKFPDRWSGGSNDFSVQRILDGHRSANRFTTDPWSEDDFDRRNQHCVEDDEDY
jgi:hypothetical protein